MTYEVYVIVDLSEEQRKKIVKDFLRVHDNDFVQRVNMTPQNPEGELKRMDHRRPNKEPIGFFDDFLVIECHWDYKHMVETAIDISNILLRNGIEEFKIELSH